MLCCFTCFLTLAGKLVKMGGKIRFGWFFDDERKGKLEGWMDGVVGGGNGNRNFVNFISFMMAY